MGSQGINIGDAVMTFIGDTTNLDTAFDSVGDKATRGLKPATEALDGVQEGFNDAGKAGEEAADTIEDAGQRTAASMREAKGEVALLGEEFGVRLPRHVRSFVAELPGVGTALSAAFSATAILFVIQALVQLSEKGSEAIAAFLYGKDVWEETTKSIVDMNQQALALGKQFEELKKKADDYGKTALQLAAEHQGEVKESITELNKQLKAEEEHFKTLEAEINKHEKTILSAAAAWQAYRSGSLGAYDALRGYLLGIDTSIVKHKELDEVENKVVTTSLKLKNAHQELRVATHEVANAQDELNKKSEALDEALSKTANELNDLFRAFNRIKAEASNVEIIPPAVIEDTIKLRAELHGLGITLRADLVEGYKAAEKAEQDYVAAGGNDLAIIKQLHQAQQQRANDLKKFGKDEESELGKQGQLWKLYEKDVQQAGNATKFFTDLGKQEFGQFTNAVGTAFVAFANHTESFKQALGEMAKSAIDSLASQAISQALYWTAVGLADTAVGDAPGASAAFAAATLFGEVAAVSGALALAAGSVGGKGGGSSAGTSFQSTQSNTSGAGRGTTSVTGVQKFAAGGLISAPTLALIGEDPGKSEAVLPLDNPESMAKIAGTIATHLAANGGGGGTVHNWNIKGLVSPDTIKSLQKQTNKMVRKGQLHAQSSQTFKITKRGG